MVKPRKFREREILETAAAEMADPNETETDTKKIVIYPTFLVNISLFIC